MSVITMERRPPAGGPAAAETGPTARVRLGIERNRNTRPEVHPFRALAVTRSYRETEGEPIAVRRGKTLYRVLDEQPVNIQAGELIVGMKTLTPRGSPVYPEINCAWVERDLDRLAARRDTPFYVSDETKRILREEVFPYWRGRQIADRINADKLRSSLRRLRAVAGPPCRMKVYPRIRGDTLAKLTADGGDEDVAILFWALAFEDEPQSIG